MIFFKCYDSLVQVPFCEDESVQLFRVAFFLRDFFQNPYFSTAAKLFFSNLKNLPTAQRWYLPFLSGGLLISSLVNKPDEKLVNSTSVRALDAHNFVKKFETANYASELEKVQ